jgi:hypothetical protein
MCCKDTAVLHSSSSGYSAAIAAKSVYASASLKVMTSSCISQSADKQLHQGWAVPATPVHTTQRGLWAAATAAGCQQVPSASYFLKDVDLSCDLNQQPQFMSS